MGKPLPPYPLDPATSDHHLSRSSLGFSRELKTWFPISAPCFLPLVLLGSSHWFSQVRGCVHRSLASEPMIVNWLLNGLEMLFAHVWSCSNKFVSHALDIAIGVLTVIDRNRFLQIAQKGPPPHCHWLTNPTNSLRIVVSHGGPPELVSFAFSSHYIHMNIASKLRKRCNRKLLEIHSFNTWSSNTWKLSHKHFIETKHTDIVPPNGR